MHSENHIQENNIDFVRDYFTNTISTVTFDSAVRPMSKICNFIAIDYNSKAPESIKFFKIVQNKLHFAAHGQTAAEVVYFRVDSEKPFAGLTNFKGIQPTQAEALVAKNYLQVDELKVLNNLVSAYFDLAEINAIKTALTQLAIDKAENDLLKDPTKRAEGQKSLDGQLQTILAGLEKSSDMVQKAFPGYVNSETNKAIKD